MTKGSNPVYTLAVPPKNGTLATISDIHNNTITINQNGTKAGSFTLNQNTNTTIDLTGNNYSAGKGIAIDGSNVISVRTNYTTNNDNRNYGVKADSNTSGLYVNVPWSDTTYAQATASTLGLVKIGYGKTGQNYPVELNDSGQMFVTVPWTDNNTTYSAGTGLSLSGTTFNVNLNYSTNGNNFKVNNGSAGLFVTVPISNYLPLTGGTLTGNLNANQNVTIKGIETIVDNYFLIAQDDKTNFLIPQKGFIDALGNQGALMASNGLSFSSPNESTYSSWIRKSELDNSLEIGSGGIPSALTDVYFT